MDYPRNTCVLAFQRSGTTLLEEFLKTNPSLSVGHEVLLDSAWGSWWCYWNWLTDKVRRDPEAVRRSGVRTAENFIEFLDHMLAHNPRAQRVVFDVKHDQIHLLNPIQGLRDVPFLIKMIRRHSWGAIHVVRRNTLAVHLSGQVAEARLKQGQEGYTSRFTGKVELNPEHLLGTLTFLDQHTAKVRGWLESHPLYFPVWYEDIMDGPRVSAALGARLAAYLGVPDEFSYEPVTVKVSPPPREAIANLAEVEACLAGTPYAAMLDDGAA